MGTSSARGTREPVPVSPRWAGQTCGGLMFTCNKGCWAEELMVSPGFPVTNSLTPLALLSDVCRLRGRPPPLDFISRLCPWAAPPPALLPSQIQGPGPAEQRAEP